MSFRKIDLVKELKRVAEGKRSSISHQRLAEWVLPRLAAEYTRDDAGQRELERLYRLEDPR
jgi:hypothetical protein